MKYQSVPCEKFFPKIVDNFIKPAKLSAIIRKSRIFYQNISKPAKISLNLVKYQQAHAGYPQIASNISEVTMFIHKSHKISTIHIKLLINLSIIHKSRRNLFIHMSHLNNLNTIGKVILSKSIYSWVSKFIVWDEGIWKQKIKHYDEQNELNILCQLLIILLFLILMRAHGNRKERIKMNRMNLLLCVNH